MTRIKQLSAQEAQKIAAGEVVERPANVVKELIENALDAHSTAITIYIEDGGRTLIRVIDNGTGMSREDAFMCIKHHATSKISTVNDLAHLLTFGFRGEALSSISAVCKMRLTTKEASSETGLSLTIEQGAVVHENIIACNTGTEIELQDLFFNVPARKKFLKSKETEWHAILTLFFAFCLDYPSVTFKLYHENKLIYSCPTATKLQDRLSHLYDRSLVQSCLFFEGSEERMNLTVSGALTDSQYNRYDRSEIFIFVNSRWVKNYKLTQALIKGYQGILPTGKYPAAFLFISVDTQYVDINIHPRKEEVQFLHPKVVENFIETTIKKRLEEQAASKLGAPAYSVKPAVSHAANKPWDMIATKLSVNQPDNSNFNLLQYTPVQQSKQNPTAFSHALEDVFSKPTDNFVIAKSLALKTPEMVTTPEPKEEQAIVSATLNYRLLGQFSTTYIIIETSEGLVLIDQHAAHERIIYENLRKNFDHVPTIKLLFPQVVTLNQQDVSAISHYLSLFMHFGVTIEPISASELIIKETPIFLKNQPLTDMIKQVVGWIREYQTVAKEQLREILQEKIHAQVSCTSAIKAGDMLTLEAMHKLINNLYTLENRLTCPHGRPTLWLMSEQEIKKKFKRDYK